MKKSEKKIKIDVDWRYIPVDKYEFYDKDNNTCINPIGKTCAILKNYRTTNHYQNNKWGYLGSVLYTIQDGIPIDFDGDLMYSCYLIKIESVL